MWLEGMDKFEGDDDWLKRCTVFDVEPMEGKRPTEKSKMI